MDKIDKKLDDLTEVVVFIKDRMATKEDLIQVEKRLDKRIDGVENRLDKVDGRLDRVEIKLDGIDRRLDDELDKRKQLEVRTAKLETKVSAK